MADHGQKHDGGVQGRDPDRDWTVGVILAGGIGTRMGLDIPKQLVPIAGKTSLEHTVGIFQECGSIDEILVMMDSGSIVRAGQLLPHDRYSKVTRILAGGQDRNDTSFLALREISDPAAKVVFHDAVRPLVDVDVIQACIDALDSYAAVDTAIPSADTIIEVDERNLLRAVPPRASLRRGQTPQGFRQAILLSAYELARRDPAFSATDDCSVVLKYRPDVPITVIPGHEANIKITHPIDIHLADKLFQLKNNNPKPVPAATSPLRKATVVVLGGSTGIGAELVRQLQEAGSHVACHSRTGSGTFVENRTSVQGALASAADRFGKIDHVVLTAGVLTVGELVTMTDEQLHHDVSVNLLAAFVVAQEAYPYLKDTHGSLLLFSSSSYTRGRANYTVYSATKAAVVNLTQALADEWSADGIRVNCISPSRTATPMREKAFGPEDQSTLVQAAAVAGSSLDVLASDATGQIFDVRLPQTDPLHHELEVIR